MKTCAKPDEYEKPPLHPLREAFLDDQADKHVLTNHFEYTVHGASVFYEYKILGISSKDRRRVKGTYEKAIESWGFLKDHKNEFATNYFDTVVAWKDLHQHITETRSRGDGVDAGLWNIDLVDGQTTHHLSFELVRRVEVNALTEYANRNPLRERENFDVIARCLNIVIAKGFNDVELYRQGVNKYFVKDARAPLMFRNAPGLPYSSQSLEIIRGYYYTVKPGMGNIILNFNLATSAFYQPIFVDEFLADKHTFPNPKVSVKHLRVYITTPRLPIEGEPKEYRDRLNQDANRIKKIHCIGTEDIENITFPKRIRRPDGSFDRNADGSYVLETSVTRLCDYLLDSKYTQDLSMTIH